MVTDCKYVAEGISKILNGKAWQLMDSEDADLWIRMAAAPVLVRWVPAHLSYEVAQARGHSLADWMGNCKADEEAKAAAYEAAPPKQLVRARERYLIGLEVVQRCLSEMQSLQLASAQKRGLRTKRRRVGPRLGKARRFAAPKRCRKARVAEAAAEVAPLGAHALVWASGPCPGRATAGQGFPYAPL